VTSALYLGLAIVTIGVLGPGAATIVPLAELLQRAIGPVGTATAAAAAVVLTLGSVNAYISGGAVMAGHLTRPRRVRNERVENEQVGSAGHAPPSPQFLVAVAASGLLLVTLYGFGVVSPAALVAIPTTLFLAVYLGSMVSAVRVLRGPARWAAVPASVAVTVMLACSGWALTLPVLVGVTVTGWRRAGRRRLGQSRERKQLPSRHHQIADAHQGHQYRSARDDDLQQ
jgi:amino acid efflux transporter